MQKYEKERIVKLLNINYYDFLQKNIILKKTLWISVFFSAYLYLMQISQLVLFELWDKKWYKLIVITK